MRFLIQICHAVDFQFLIFLWEMILCIYIEEGSDGTVFLTVKSWIEWLFQYELILLISLPSNG